ncbi:MAG: succinyl-CoA synthetase subunit beta [Paracoccaceae bacterium]
MQFLISALAVCATLWATSSFADTVEDRARAFAENCFSPYLTARKAKRVLGGSGARYDFYDLDPFSNVAPSPAFGVRPATPGTDRRCEVSFDGVHTDVAVNFALSAVKREGLFDEEPVPDAIQRLPSTNLLAARRLNPRKIAVIHIGTRAGPNTTETFMTLERLPNRSGTD